MDGYMDLRASALAGGETSGAEPDFLQDRWSVLLDRARSGDVVATVYETADALLGVKKKLRDVQKWRAFVESPTFSDLRTALQEDPFSARAAAKPRGYPGDAVLLDMAYRILGPPDGTSELGQQAFNATTNSPGSRSVRARKRYVAEYIDSVAATIDRPRIASVACGHLRELSASQALRDGHLGEFLGIDQDVDSIAVVQETFGSRGVVPRSASLKEFLSGQVSSEPFHAIYSAGLYDYLDEPTAVKATAGMFRLLQPGGRLLIANLTPSLIDVAYMEAVMDWWLIYRTREEIGAIAKAAVAGTGAEIHTFTDVLGNIAFAEIARKSK